MCFSISEIKSGRVTFYFQGKNKNVCVCVCVCVHARVCVVLVSSATVVFCVCFEIDELFHTRMHAHMHTCRHTHTHTHKYTLCMRTSQYKEIFPKYHRPHFYLQEYLYIQ